MLRNTNEDRDLMFCPSSEGFLAGDREGRLLTESFNAAKEASTSRSQDVIITLLLRSHKHEIVSR